EVAFLTSGTDYSIRWSKPQVHPRHWPGVVSYPSYALWNSELAADAYWSHYSRAAVEAPGTTQALLKFMRETGPFDILHLHNLEGFPVAALAALRRECPRLEIVLSLHNYYAFCPQVHLWQHGRQHCEDFHGGQRCVGCRDSPPDAKELKAIRKLDTAISAIHLPDRVRRKVEKLKVTKKIVRRLAEHEPTDQVPGAEFFSWRRR